MSAILPELFPPVKGLEGRALKRNREEQNLTTRCPEKATDGSQE